MSSISLSDLPGLWRRSLISWPDGRRDTTSRVDWLQGPSLYADLRQPEGRPDFSGTRCLRDLDPVQIAWLARQEGFAGHLVCRDEAFEWQRLIDFQPAAPLADAGSLRMDGNVMIEEGCLQPYIEHWHATPTGPGPKSAWLLRDEAQGAEAVLVLVGQCFLFARGRSSPLPAGPSLAALTAEARTREAAQDLLDCEISLGWLREGAWCVDRSTFPWQEGRAWTATFRPGCLSLADQDARGAAFERLWSILAVEGDGSAPPALT